MAFIENNLFLYRHRPDRRLETVPSDQLRDHSSREPLVRAQKATPPKPKKDDA
jgi:hypothetical protein